MTEQEIEKIEKESNIELRESMIKDGAVPNFEGGVYLTDGYWIFPDGTLREW